MMKVCLQVDLSIMMRHCHRSAVWWRRAAKHQAERQYSASALPSAAPWRGSSPLGRPSPMTILTCATAWCWRARKQELQVSHVLRYGIGPALEGMATGGEE